MRHTFTLVELMITVAIVALLGAIAIPRFQSYQTDARLAEPAVMVDGAWPILTQAWKNGDLPQVDWTTGAVPRSQVDRELVDWYKQEKDGPTINLAGAETLRALGIEPDGGTRCSYDASGALNLVILMVRCDLNGDGVQLSIGTVQADQADQPPVDSIQLTCNFASGAVQNPDPASYIDDIAGCIMKDGYCVTSGYLDTWDHSGWDAAMVSSMPCR